ncbi:MAG TPA: putative lipid II flippase FtsW [Pyrinomonadaceae bacterium]|jgi:cell division protein FtsW|nr:putative lipid II flippase FtsW [Pyrinomonadaceae bacterium]
MSKKLAPDKWLFAATIGLALFGVVMVYSASAMMAQKENGNQFYYVLKQGAWVAIGFVVMLLAMQFNYQQLKSRRVVYGLLFLSTVTLLSVFAFSSSNGAHRWIKLPWFSVQPSEMSKLALVIFLAYFLEKRAGEEGDLFRTFVPCGIVTCWLAGLIVIEPDLGTALMLALIFFVLIYTAGARLIHLAMAAAPALLGVIGLLLFVPWRLKRLITFLDPWADPQGGGFQVVQSLIAVGSGGSNGLGFAQGKQKMLFLPFAHSDFIFAVVSEELGLVGGLAVILVFGLFLWRGVRTALLAPDRFGMLLSFGIVTSIVAQALFNISVVLSLVPTKGIPLPFISYGGSSLVPTLAAVGILLNISQHASGSVDMGLMDSVRNKAKERRRLKLAAETSMTPSRF